MSKSITVLGGGAFGTAFSTILLENGFPVTLWCHEAEVADEINQSKTNSRYLEGVHLPEEIKSTCDLKEAPSSEWVFVAIPVKFLRAVLEEAKPHITENHKFVILSKGIEQKTLMLPGDIIDDVLGYKASKLALGGPNFALEIVNKQYTATTIASDDKSLLLELKQIVSNFYFKPYLSDDLIGVQVCSALKNVLALAVGIARGAGFKDNTKAILITLGLSEIGNIIEALGGNKETIYSFAGLGDTILTCTGSLGRNLKVGTMIGEGKSLDEIDKMGITAEGLNTVQSTYELIKKHNLDLPICLGTHDIIFSGFKIRDVMDKVMS